VGWSYIANAGTTVGSVFSHATIWNGTTPTDLNNFLSIRDVNLGWALIEATGINDNGWIVGNAWNIQTWESSVFLLNPCDICPIAQVPEPETYAMFMAGLGLMGFIARRRKNGRS
jgi:uncharacterized membrane protein